MESDSIDYWRKFFRSATSDIFVVIEKAIAVAATDHPDAFLASRDRITETLFTCVRGDHTEVVLGLKELLLNYENQDDAAVVGALRRLELMRLSFEMLQATGIGVAVNELTKHRSCQIADLARTLVGDWRALAKRSWKTMPAIEDTPLDSVNPFVISEEARGKTTPAIAETPPESVSPSVVSEQTGEELDLFYLQLPPLDEGALLAINSAQYEFPKFFDGMDEDGNLRDNVETCKNERSQLKEGNDARTQQVMCHGDEGHMTQDITANQPKPLNIFDEASEALTDSGPGRPSKLASDGKHDQVGSNRQTKPVATNLGPGRPKLATEQKCSGGKQDLARNLKKPSTTLLDSDEAALLARLPLAKKRLTEGYREAANAKKRRTIQILEFSEIPKQTPIERRFNVKASGRR